MTKKARKAKQKQYVVIVTEVVQDNFTIAAGSQQKAVDTARALYRSGKLVLEPGELRKVTFKAFPGAIAELKNPRT